MLAKSRDVNSIVAIQPGQLAEQRFGRRSTPQSVSHSRTRRNRQATSLLARTRLVAEACLEELPEPYRAVLRLRDVEALAPGDVAARLNIGADLMTVRLERARRLLALALCRRCRLAGVTR